MERILFLLFILYSLFVASPMPAAAESQTWKVRPGDNLDIIATTLEIPKEEIQKHNPGVLESNLQIGQKLKLPLRSYVESKTLAEELSQKDERIGKLESKSSDLEKQIASAESQLAWHPIWLWGFWISFGIIAFIVSGAYWIFRQTHPQVFEQPHDRSIGDLRESEIRARSSFPHDEEGASSRAGQWQLSLKRLPAHRQLERIFARQGERGIVRAYKEHGYRIREIAAHLGVHYSTVSRRLNEMEQEE